MIFCWILIGFHVFAIMTRIFLDKKQWKNFIPWGPGLLVCLRPRTCLGRLSLPPWVVLFCPNLPRQGRAAANRLNHAAHPSSCPASPSTGSSVCNSKMDGVVRWIYTSRNGITTDRWTDWLTDRRTVIVAGSKRKCISDLRHERDYIGCTHLLLSLGEQ